VDKAEARGIALVRLNELRRLSWAELRDGYLDQPKTVEAMGTSGTMYQVETLAIWDGPVDGDLRVMVSIDDGGWRAFAPLGVDFILAPDGSFVGD
jgi:hypothetical protein